MDEYSDFSIATALTWRPVKVGLFLLSLLLLMIAAALICLTVTGYGTISFENFPTDSVATLNGHALTSATLKLRPGSYKLVVTSPTLSPYEDTIRTGLFSHRTYKPVFKPRSIDAIARSLLGAVPGTSIPPQLTNVRQFDGNAWAAGTLTPTDTVLVIHYDSTQKQWAIAFCNSPGYPSDISTLPAAVSGYIQPLLSEVQ